jgi:K+-transporting ATPase ATPase B chain
MIALVEGAERQKTPNEIALNILLAGLTLVFLFACVTLVPMALYSGMANVSVTVMCGATGLLDSNDHRRIAFRHWHCRHRSSAAQDVLAMSGRAVEAAGDVDTLLLDKTGTITLGNRMATEFIPIDGVGRGSSG